MHRITIPKLNTNDESCILAEWLVSDGQMVRKGEPIAVIETSKATEDLTSNEVGVFHRTTEAGVECQCGQIIGYLFANEDEHASFLVHNHPSQSAEEQARSSLVITQLAQELIAEHHIISAQLHALRKKVIKSTDIEALVESRSGAKKRYPLAKHQQAVARVVMASHQRIPTAFTVSKIYAQHVLSEQKQFQENEQVDIGIPEILVKVTADTCLRYPLFLGCLENDNTVLLSDEINIGVTIDIGKGLSLPVIKQAHQKSLGEIAEVLMDFRIKALREAFREEDLEGGSISISLNTEAGVVWAQPLIFPPQICMLSLGALQEELFLEANKDIGVRPYFYLGLAYDHRVLNGRETSLFLKELKNAFESSQLLHDILRK